MNHAQMESLELLLAYINLKAGYNYQLLFSYNGYILNGSFFSDITVEKKLPIPIIRKLENNGFNENEVCSIELVEKTKDIIEDQHVSSFFKNNKHVNFDEGPELLLTELVRVSKLLPEREATSNYIYNVQQQFGDIKLKFLNISENASFKPVSLINLEASKN